MKIICVGFFGHGNAGDEAIARSFQRYLQAPFNNVELSFSTEMAPEEAQKINEANAFYGERNIISVYDLETIKDPDIVIVGGGDLSATYGLSQVLRAREVSRVSLLARIGTSAKDDFLRGGEKAVNLVKASLSVFDYISVRDRASADVLGVMGLKPHMGADLAIDFPVAENSLELRKPYAIMTVREVRDNDASRQIKTADAILKSIRREVKDIYLLPFCEADQRFILDGPARPEVKILKDAWKEPDKLAFAISKAEFVVSVGRLHPLVFAIGNRVPCFAVTYPWLSGYDKVNGFMHHAGMGHRVADWGLPAEEIAAMAHDAIKTRSKDKESLNIYSGYLKGLMLESLCPIWGAMRVSHGLGLERGMKKGEFRVDDYDSSYFYGSRVYKAGNELKVYHPTRGDWEGWDTIRDLIVQTMRPQTLLDVGCGRGWFLKRMVDMGIKVEGIDGSVAAWQDAAPGMQQYIKVAGLKDVEHRRYDVVTAFDVMEHIFEDDIESAVEALKNAAGRYLVLNICVAPDNENIFSIKKNGPVPDDLEWLAVSGHVTIKHKAWWKGRLEDDDWEVDEDTFYKWFNHPGFRFPSWQAHNLMILRRRGAK